jgi:Fic family protein
MDISNTAGLWDAVKPLLEKYRSLKLSENIDYDKFYLYSLIAHSTAVEGSTLTEEETRLLLDEGLTANGKPLAHHLMNTDLRDAYVLARDKARSKEAVTIDLLREFNAAVMKSTGGPISAMAGSFDSSKGEFRLLNVTAGFKGRSYTAYQKVPAMTARFCEDLQNELSRGGQDARQLYELSFKAHLNLVTIHPWRDGNGRTARLLMK